MLPLEAGVVTQTSGHLSKGQGLVVVQIITINQRNHTGSYVHARNDRLQPRFSCAVH